MKSKLFYKILPKALSFHLKKKKNPENQRFKCYKTISKKTAKDDILPCS